MSSYAHAVRRFWWVVVIGIVVAVIAMFVVARSGAETYTSISEVLVTSPQAPYVRISVTDTQATAPTGQTGGGGRATTTPLATSSAPDVNTLVRAANLYPFFIESDLVARRRDRMFGALEGTVAARAIFAVQNALRFDPSEIPIIQIAGTAATPGGAVKISQATTDAFRSWIKISQDDAGLAPRERIVIEQIRRPTEIFVAGGTPTSLVLLVGLVLAFAFAALAVLLDRNLRSEPALEATGAQNAAPGGSRRKAVDVPAVASGESAQTAMSEAGAESDSELRESRRWA